MGASIVFYRADRPRWNLEIRESKIFFYLRIVYTQSLIDEERQNISREKESNLFWTKHETKTIIL